MKTLLQYIIILGFSSCINMDADDTPSKDGALDEIVLSEFSRDTPGIVLFPHRLHAAALEEGGRGIQCGSCHHDFEGPTANPPGSCRKCHLYHDHGDADLPAL